MGFPMDFPIELMAFGFLLFKYLVTPGLKPAEAIFQTAGLSSINPEGGVGERSQKLPVMTYYYQSCFQGSELILQPFNRRYVQMVGGLIQQEDIRRGRQSRRQGAATRLAPRHGGQIFLTGEAQLL